jgi:hypothetical protein
MAHHSATVVMVGMILVAGWAQASSTTSQTVAKTLDEAIRLAGPSIAGLPIVLAGVPPAEASRGVEAWTLRAADGSGELVVVYSESAFHCASNPNRLDYQCLSKLASAIVHEAWHYKYGLDETGAYDAQIAYLTTRGGSGYMIAGVRLARAHVLNARQAIERRRQ